jgi:malate synthase
MRFCPVPTVGCSMVKNALGQTNAMSLDNQRNLKLAIHKDPLFLKVAEGVAREMNKWALEFFGEPTIQDWKTQLDFTTKIFRARGLHLDDRHIRNEDGVAMAASIVDLAIYVTNNHGALLKNGSSVVFISSEDPDG